MWKRQGRQSNTRRINLGTKQCRYAHLEESKKIVTMRDWNIVGGGAGALSQKEMATAPLFWEFDYCGVTAYFYRLQKKLKTNTNYMNNIEFSFI